MTIIKMLIVSVFFSVGAWADGTALFGRVANVAKNDVLNVRANPNHKATKVGVLSFDAGIGVEKCKTVKNSNWCRVYPLVQNLYENFSQKKNIGWVNAQYLSFKNRGYVTIKGKENSCFYALKCRNKKSKVECLVVTDTKINDKYDIVGLKTKWFDRSLLKGESGFGAASNDMDGYCTWGNKIEDYLKR